MDLDGLGIAPWCCKSGDMTMSRYVYVFARVYVYEGQRATEVYEKMRAKVWGSSLNVSIKGE